MGLGEGVQLEQMERTKVLTSEIAGLLSDVRENISVSRKLLQDAPKVPSTRENVRLVIPEIGFFTWFVAGNLYHGDSLFAALHGMEVEDLAAGVAVEDLLGRMGKSDQPQVAHGLFQAIKTGERCYLEYSTYPGGTQRKVVLTGCCLRNELGLASFFCGIVIEKKAALVLDGSEPFQAYCDAALSLARERGNLLAARYLKSALNSVPEKTEHV
jgi:hypothetical protein